VSRVSLMSLAFEDNGTMHGDLAPQLDHFDRRCDSFYLAADPDLLPDRNDAAKVRLVLVRLLEQWRVDVNRLAAGAPTFLPYESDDQASEWLQVTAVADEAVTVLPVWSDLGGWAFNPSTYSNGTERIGDTTPVWDDFRPQAMTRAELLDQIDRCITAARVS
jgi:hypothetical protein